MEARELIPLALAVFAALVAGWVLATVSGAAGGRGRQRELRDRERGETEKVLGRLRRQLEDSEGRSRDQMEVFVVLPGLLRQLFAATSRRQIGPLAVKLVDQIFQPAQCAFFYVNHERRKLSLAHGQGLPSGVGPGLELGLGDGRLGHVAENRRAMDEADFRNLTPTVRRHLETTGTREIEAEVVAPVEDDGALVGVICLAAARSRRGEEKRLLRMVAELTGLATGYVSRLSRTQDDAERDGLTGVHNKRYFENRLAHEVHQAETRNVPMGLLLLDLDHFKNYNDRNGHLEGDALLRELGLILRNSIRQEDVVARYGGEEFVLLYPRAGKETALRIADNLRRAVEAHAFRHGDGQPLGKVTISGGVASFPEDARSALELQRCADRALYEAKAAGRNRIVGAPKGHLT
jgi:diguanylate cyclase (GGDEF)-like protein